MNVTELYQMGVSSFPGYLHPEFMNDCIAIRDLNERCDSCVAVVLPVYRCGPDINPHG